MPFGLQFVLIHQLQFYEVASFSNALRELKVPVKAGGTGRSPFGIIQRGGKHWCNWSITSTYTRWRANGGKSYGLGCTGPNDMRSGCR